MEDEPDRRAGTVLKTAGTGNRMGFDCTRLPPFLQYPGSSEIERCLDKAWVAGLIPAWGTKVFASVAQLVERCVEGAGVAVSTPAGSTSFADVGHR